MGITQLEIKEAKPRLKPYALADGHGLSLVIAPNGSKLWRFKFQLNKKQRMMSLGSFPLVPLADARQLHMAARQKINSGIDPMGKITSQAEPVVEDGYSAAMIANGWFDHWKVGKDPLHIAHVRTRLDVDILPVIGALSVDHVKPSHIVRIVKQVEARGALDLARRAFQTCSQIFRYGIAHALTENNPAASIKPADLLKPVKAVNMARVQEKELAKLLADIDDYNGEVITRFGLKLAMYTAVRTSELIEAPWTEFDLDAARWEIAPERMKMGTRHIVPLSRQVVDIMRALKLITGRSKFVLPGVNSGTMSNNTMLYALYRMGYQGKQTVHGFRGIFSTVMHEKGKRLGFTHDMIEIQLAHLEGDAVSRAYNAAEYLDERTVLMQWWADYLDEQRAKG
jgi:integrase